MNIYWCVLFLETSISELAAGGSVLAAPSAGQIRNSLCAPQSPRTDGHLPVPLSVYARVYSIVGTNTEAI